MSARVVACPSCATRNRVPAMSKGRPRCALCRGWLPWVTEAGDHEWPSVVEHASVPVLVDFWAEWCGPCRTVAPVLEELAAEYAGRVKLVKVNVDHSPQTSQRFSVQSIPTLAVFDRGRVVARQTGAAGPDALRHWRDGALDRI